MNEKVRIDIPLAIVGCDFRVAGTAYREHLVTDPDKRAALYAEIQKIDRKAGFVAVETCNRQEWIVSTKNTTWMAELLKARIVSEWREGFKDQDDIPSPSVYVGEEAVSHILNVVVGRESLAVGEAQIAGQFQDALNTARAEKTSSLVLNRLGSAAGRIAKAGYRIGFRSNHRQGIHGLVSLYLKRQWREEARSRKIAVVGMGSIGRKTAQLLDETPDLEVIRVNRTIRPEQEKSWRSLDELPAISNEVDAIIMATGGLKPVLTADGVDLSGRGDSLLVMDIGIPRQVSPSVRDADGVVYQNIDHLLELPREREDQEAVARIEAEIQKEMDHFKRFCMERDMVLLLDRIHQGSQDFVYRRIPAHVEEEFGELDEKTRKKMEGAMRKFIKEYARDIHSALQTALEEHWGQE